jgi:hypothetical protein
MAGFRAGFGGGDAATTAQRPVPIFGTIKRIAANSAKLPELAHH